MMPYATAPDLLTYRTKSGRVLQFYFEDRAAPAGGEELWCVVCNAKVTWQNGEETDFGAASRIDSPAVPIFINREVNAFLEDVDRQIRWFEAQKLPKRKPGKPRPKGPPVTARIRVYD